MSDFGVIVAVGWYDHRTLVPKEFRQIPNYQPLFGDLTFMSKSEDKDNRDEFKCEVFHGNNKPKIFGLNSGPLSNEDFYQILRECLYEKLKPLWRPQE